MRVTLIGIFLVLCPTLLAIAQAQVVIPAWQVVERSGGVVPADPNHEGLLTIYGKRNHVVWEASLPEKGPWYLHVRYASGKTLPCTLEIDGRVVQRDFLEKPTGGFGASNLAWARTGPFSLTKGQHRILITLFPQMPHFQGLVFSRSEEPPVDVCFPKPQGALPTWPPVRSDWPTTVSGTLAPMDSETAFRNRKRLQTLLPDAEEILFIKRVPYTSSHYYTEYVDSKWAPGGGIFALSLRDGTTRQIAGELKGGVFGRMDLSFDGEKIVFDWKAGPDDGYRIYQVGINGKGLRRVLDPPAHEATIVKTYRNWYHHGTDDMHPCWLPDGGIAFVSTRCMSGTLCDVGDALTTTVLYRVESDGSGLQRLSFGALSEATPSVMADGRILYTRWEYVDKGAVAAKGLWAVRPDGTASEEVYGNDIAFPTSMVQARDIPGARHRIVMLGCPHYPGNMLGTVILVDTRQSIRTGAPMKYITPSVKVMMQGGWHFRHAGTTETVVDYGGHGPLFRDPFPLDVDHFLVAHKPFEGGGAYAKDGYGLYLLPSHGTALPFYRDPEISCWQPIPVRARPVPPVLRTAVDASLARQGMARCVVTDVYHGLEDVERGSIKHIRVLEQVARPWQARRFGRGDADMYDQQHAVISKDTALGLKVQYGIVPVEKDGSAHFLVKANANIFFQALDENHMAVQTERTFVNYMPGETRSCVGCHETPNQVARTRGTPVALRRAPSLPGPQPGETTGQRPLHYATDVQPVLDRHCIQCHGEKDRLEAGLDLTDRMTVFFCASYENLIEERRYGESDWVRPGKIRRDRIRPALLPTIGENHPKAGNVHYLPARSLGSHNSLLVAMLAPDKVHLTGDQARMARWKKLAHVHREIRQQITPEALLRITNWVDTNAQYYGSYYGRRNLKDRDHPNFRPVPTWDSARGESPLPEAER